MRSINEAEEENLTGHRPKNNRAIFKDQTPYQHNKAFRKQFEVGPWRSCIALRSENY